MTIDWTTVLVATIESGVFVTVAGWMIYRKQNKSIKNSEAQQKASEAQNADTEAQTKQIDLSVKFAHDMLDLMQQVKQANLKSDDNQAKIIEKLERLDAKVDRLEGKVTCIEEFLDGPFHQYQAEREARIKELEQ